MGKSSDAPAPPDPRVTSAAQTGTNVGTAIANTMLGFVDQQTPWGSLSYERIGSVDPSTVPGIEEIAGVGPSTTQRVEVGRNDRGRPIYRNQTSGPSAQYRVGDQTFSSYDAAERHRNSLLNDGSGSYTYRDPFTGQSYEIPRFRSTIELSPEQQEILDASQRSEANLANLADERSEFLLDYLPNTESLTDQIGGALYDMGRERLDPRFAEQEDALRTRLANQGIMTGSEAYDREMRNFEESRNDAYNSLMLQGRGQALSEINNPINQITALLSNSQVTSPPVQMQNPAQIPTTDVAGLINDNYSQRLGAWSTNQSNNQGMLGGLFGAGATLLGAPQGSVFGGWLGL